jgi:hypothetical protein
MKYMMNGAVHKNHLIRLTLSFTLFFLFLFWIINFFLFYAKMGFQPETVASYFAGSEENFQPARSSTSMLEVSHGHTAIMAVVLLLLTHLAVFFPIPLRWRVGLISLTFGSALLNELSGWLIRFLHPGFAWLKLAAFGTLQFSLIILISGLLYWLWRGPDYGNSNPH